MIKLTVKKSFAVHTQNKDINANVGDIITVKNKGVDYYYIVSLNSTRINSTWMRKNYINFHC